jgi:hypothetical protein
MRSLLPVVEAADKFPSYSTSYPLFHPETKEVYTPFHISFSDHARNSTPLGLIKPNILAAIAQSPIPGLQVHPIGDGQSVVCFSEQVIKENQMTEVINGIAEYWKREGLFPELLKGESASNKDDVRRSKM